MQKVFNQGNTLIYNSEISKRRYSIFWLILLIVIISAVSLPSIKLDISVKSQGIIRPKNEKKELKSSINELLIAFILKKEIPEK